MSVYIETSLGDIVIDLFVDECPKACKNFLKLCKIKYYHNCIFHTVQRGFIVQTGDPTNSGKGGSSIYGLLFGEQARLFEDEVHPEIRHREKGMVAMASAKPDQNASQFYITTGTDLHGLDDKHTIFGKVEEGMDVLDRIDRSAVDEEGRPWKNIRIRRTEVFEDPFDDPPGLDSLLRDSPEPQFEFGDRLEEDWEPTNDTRTAEEVEADMEKQKAANRKIVLEMIGDRPEAEAKPPEDMIFVCKLNPVTTEEDLETIFSRFGTITSCDIVRDKRTGESLNYAFIGFDSKEAAEEAFLKMNNALVDDRRIKVDFSQSMYHLWKQFRRFGKKGGDASMKKAAEDHGRTGQGGGRLLDGGRFELTTGNRHGFGTGHYGFVHRGDEGRDRSHRKENGKRHRSPEPQGRDGPARHQSSLQGNPEGRPKHREGTPEPQRHDDRRGDDRVRHSNPASPPRDGQRLRYNQHDSSHLTRDAPQDSRGARSHRGNEGYHRRTERDDRRDGEHYRRKDDRQEEARHHRTTHAVSDDIHRRSPSKSSRHRGHDEDGSTRRHRRSISPHAARVDDAKPQDHKHKKHKHKKEKKDKHKKRSRSPS